MSSWVVSQADAGQQLVAFLARRLPSYPSKRALKLALESNSCRVNGVIERFASLRLKPGDRVAFFLGEIKKASPPAILWEDEHYIAVDKPVKLVCDSTSLPHLLVHRLDRLTSGVLLLAKEAVAQKLAEALFRKRSVQKRYLAVVDGLPTQKKGRIVFGLGRCRKQGEQKIWEAVPRGRGMAAETEWVSLKRGDAAALLACFPKSGRMHQIRVHLRAIGHPIIGDSHYERCFVCPYFAQRPLLHAEELGFTHPFTGEKVRIKAPLPPDFRQAIEELF